MCTGTSMDLAQPDLDRIQVLQAGWVCNNPAGTGVRILLKSADGVHKASPSPGGCAGRFSEVDIPGRCHSQSGQESLGDSKTSPS